MNVRMTPQVLIPTIITVVFAALGLLGTTQALENLVFDQFLRLKKSPQELTKSIALVDFDDQSVEKAGTWPIARNIMADGLMLLRECGSRYAVFDIEYVNKSPRGINSDILSQDIPESFSNNFGAIGNQMQSLIGAVQQGNIPLREVGPYVQDFQKYLSTTKDDLQAEVSKIALDNDEYLGNAVRFHGNAFLTLHMITPRNDKIPEEARKLAQDRFALKDAKIQGGRPTAWPDLQPPILPIESQARGLGFTNVIVDPDGVRRRIDIVSRSGAYYFPQLVMAPVLDMLGHPSITVGRRDITLTGAHYPDGSVRTVRIPLDSAGHVIVNWPHKTYEDSFGKHLSFAELIQHKELYDDLVYNLKLRESWGYLDEYKGETPLLELNRQGEALRDLIMAGEEPSTRVADYRALRDKFVHEVGAYLDSKPEDQIAGTVAAVLADRKTKAAEREQFKQIGQDAPEYFKALRKNYTALVAIRSDIIGRVDGTMCILGETDTGSTDLGINPFAPQYPNVGTHASLANMILNEDFISETPIWMAVVLAILCTAALAYALRNTKPRTTIIAGLCACVAVVGVDAGVFALTGQYTPVLPALLSMFFSFLALTFMQFLKTEQEKGFIRNAFSHYLSEAVIKDIVGNPAKLKLGGDLRYMTAVFTDIKGFSTISEHLSPEDLVRLLNEYLTGMSDCILDLGGTIDKYEGDAIISFFGAPLDLPDHALKACQAAVRMKKIEDDLNVRFLNDGLAPSKLLTRMGINSGDMVVGNMGTTKKMNYTIMGDSVNLAARLEGVNKQYGTWLCISEDTMRAAESGIEVRRLDRIRVVGKSQPIRIFELLEEKGRLDQQRAEVLDLFETALSEFEARRWDAAETGFKRVLEVAPDDGPSHTYLERIARYKETPPPDNWDGVFNLTVK